jgi:ubiquinone/menaquinone biosynthesis C-methylase UbiE
VIVFSVIATKIPSPAVPNSRAAFFPVLRSYMLHRILEPEVMDTQEEALDYDAMDHSDVNRVFVNDFLSSLQAADLWAEDMGNRSESLKVLDVGTGTAQIPIELFRRSIFCNVTAIDLSAEMLKVAARNVAEAGLEHSILTERIDAKTLPYNTACFDAVISNSIVHHIPKPVHALREMIRVLSPGGVLFLRDLLRPNDSKTLDQLVATYAGDANQHQQQMFRDSLNAALTLSEMRQILSELDKPVEWVVQTTDRHWTLNGCLEKISTTP